MTQLITSKIDLVDMIVQYYHTDLLQKERQAEIEETVRRMGSTLVVGPVRVTYSNPRKTYNYQQAAGGIATPEQIEAFTKETTTTTTDWKALVESLGIEDVPYTQAPDKATIKIEDDNIPMTEEDDNG